MKHRNAPKVAAAKVGPAVAAARARHRAIVRKANGGYVSKRCPCGIYTAYYAKQIGHNCSATEKVAS